MTSGGSPVARLRRLPPAVWVAAVLVVAGGLIAALGGFAPGQDRGRAVAPGEQILLQRWHVSVERATLVDDSYPGSDPDPRLRIRLRTEFTGDKTLCCLSERMLEVRYAGQVVTRSWPADGELRSSLGFDPGVEVTRVLEFPLEPERFPAAPPDRVQVVVRDERPSRSLILTDWAVAGAVATVELPCPDERARR
jgi:hypothetical protein